MFLKRVMLDKQYLVNDPRTVWNNMRVHDDLKYYSMICVLGSMCVCVCVNACLKWEECTCACNLCANAYISSSPFCRRIRKTRSNITDPPSPAILHNPPDHDERISLCRGPSIGIDYVFKFVQKSPFRGNLAP